MCSGLAAESNQLRVYQVDTEEHVECRLGLVSPNKIQCFMPKMTESITLNLKIKRGEYESETFIFDYREPEIESISPDYGVEEGGTIITISGINLNTGKEQRVLINGNNCEITEPVSESEIICSTPPNNSSASAEVQVYFDKLSKQVKQNFNYITINDFKSCKHPCQGTPEDWVNVDGLFCPGGTDVMIMLESMSNLNKTQNQSPVIYLADYPEKTSQCQITQYDPNKKPMKEIETIMRGPSPTLSQFYYICPSPDLRNLLPDCENTTTRKRRATDNMNLRLKFDNWEKSLVDSIAVFRAPVILPNQETVMYSPNSNIEVYFKFESPEALSSFPPDSLSFKLDDFESAETPKSIEVGVESTKSCDSSNQCKEDIDQDNVMMVKVELPKELPKKSIGTRQYILSYQFGANDEQTEIKVENKGMSVQWASVIGITAILVILGVGAVVYFLWSKMKAYQGMG